MVPTVSDNVVEWPSRGAILEVQSKVSHCRAGAQSDEDGLIRVEEKVWIPDEADHMKLKLLTV